ncbi:MAG TPA: SGNH/GDSL hydrolase family protein [Kofleriaceae bacterium]|jgi:lysophospholipase L1-like esterase|nr:SGNH/GDSL hydrolase family protein [Kofleriaceae bacterium]
MRRYWSAITGVIGGALLVASSGGQARIAAAEPAGRWADTWVAMPQLTEPGNLPPPPFTTTTGVFLDSTLRQTLHVTVGGSELRVRFSNAFGDTALIITAAHFAVPAGGVVGGSAIRAGSDRTLTFQGRSSVTIPAGAQAVSDPLNLAVSPGDNLAVTIFLAQGQPSLNITSHPGSRTTTFMVAGNHVSDLDLAGATQVDHWYFLSGVQVMTAPATSGAVMLGDSLTDGRGSTTNHNDRWPDQLAVRLRAHRSTDSVAVLNQAAGGNRILNDGLGPNLLARLDRDLLAHSGVRWTIVFEGINDIGTADATADAQRAVGDELIRAYEQIIVRAHDRGIAVYGATLTPMQGSLYTDTAGLREATRQAVNHWIRTSGRFDAVIDFDRAARDPGNPTIIAPAFDAGDHLHLNPAGYQVLAEAVDLGLFRVGDR